MPAAAARPTNERFEDTSAVDVTRAINTVAAVSDRVAGHLDLDAVAALGETDLESLDRRTAADLDRRLAPVFGRGPTRVAGLRTLAGDFDPEAVAARVGPGVTTEGSRILADVGLATASVPARDVFDADAVTAVSVADDELGGVESFALGVDVDGSFRARVSGEGVSVAESRATLRELGLSASVVQDLSPVDRGEDVTFHGSFERTDGEQPFIVAVLLVLLAAVVGTFVLGVGDSVEQRAPQVSFRFEFDAEGHALVLHQGGDHVDASRLRLVYTSDGRRRIDRWRDADGAVEAGDTYRTRGPLDAGTQLRVIWSSPDGSTSAVLGTVTAPN